MNIVKMAFCRVFQMAFRLVLPVLPYREPQIIHSCGDLGTVLTRKRIQSVLIITDNGIMRNGLTVPLESALRENNLFITK